MGSYNQNNRTEVCGCEGGRERMYKIIRDVVETVLFIFLFTLVMGIWACLWVPPF